MPKGINEIRLHRELEKIFNPILSPRQPFDRVIESMEELENSDYEFVQHWVKVIAVSNLELAYAFACEVGRFRRSLSIKSTRVWLNQCLAIYDREGLYPAVKALKEIDVFKQKYTSDRYTCYLEEVKPGLELFIRGLAGRDLSLRKSDTAYTDTFHLYLPESITKYGDKDKNRSLYKAMACFLWAQNWYGTFRRHDHSRPSTETRLSEYKDPEKARQYFLNLENIRLLYCIERDLPGLYREINALSPMLLPQDKTWKTISSRLKQENSSVEDSFECVSLLMTLKCQTLLTEYQGSLILEEVEAAIEDRRNEIIQSVHDLLDSRNIDRSQLEEAIDSFNSSDSTNDPGSGGDIVGGGEQTTEEHGGGSSELGELFNTLLQDVDYIDRNMFEDVRGETIETDLLMGGGSFDEGLVSPFSEVQVLEIDEWDYLRSNYRRKWCRVYVHRIEKGDESFKSKTEQKYPYLISQIRKVFEAMRDQPRYANRQTDGDEIDLDAVVETFTAKLAGEELTERMYIRRQQSERSVAVCLLVDMSGSTKGWINLAMRESLILFGRALNTLGDPYAILGFSGLTRQRCEIYKAKDFEEINSEDINARIANIQAKDYTRMGFAVRYAIQELLKTTVKHRILLILSDGKPDDYDGYQGEYGIQDTRKAILEAQGHGIRPYSITIDKQAQIYLPRLFGPGQYMILDKVSALPMKLTEVYRKLSA